MILLIGQVAREQAEREAFQEVDFRRMFGQVTKWTAQIEDARRIPEYISQAFHRAVIVEKLVGSLAESGADLEQCKAFGDRINKHTASMGVRRWRSGRARDDRRRDLAATAGRERSQLPARAERSRPGAVRRGNARALAP